MRRIDPTLPALHGRRVSAIHWVRAPCISIRVTAIPCFRIHGTNEPWSIGDAVSSGCVRLLNEDIVDLYNRVQVGARVTRAARRRRGLTLPLLPQARI